MTKKHLSLAVLAGLLLAGCDEDPQAFWTPEQCNTRIEMDIVTFEKYQESYRQDVVLLDTETRRGNTASLEGIKKAMESRKEATRSLLKFIDTNIAKFCKKEVYRADLVAKLDQARAFASDTGSTASAAPEGMPELRVASVQSTFVPYKMDQFGRCEGPFLDLIITVQNNGADFPRPVDLEQFAALAQKPAAELEFFGVAAEFDFGNEMKKRLDFTVKGDVGAIKSGGTYQIPAQLRIEHNQTSAKVKGTVSMRGYLKNAENTQPYETEIDVPIWDIYTFSHQAVGGKDQDNGKYYIGGKGTVTNLGKSPTPGPVEASFVIQDAETGVYITGWTEKTDGPVSGNTDIYGKSFTDRTLPKTIKVASSVTLLCPDGSSGNLADGNAANNSRELKQQ